MVNYQQAFADHQLRRETGSTWLCRSGDRSTYWFRIMWSRGALVIVGDVGDMIVRHCSFGDPWSAAAWVNGAGWSYFMEKSQFGREYCGKSTAEFIVELAYQAIRNDREDRHLFEEMNDELGLFGGGDPETAEGRKTIAREFLAHGECGDLTAPSVYGMTGDPETILMAYPERYRWQYEAIKWWASEMWRTEPVWHKCLRLKRSMLGRLRRWVRPRPWERIATEASAQRA